MKAAHLIILPLCALAFVLFLYWLAVQNAPPVHSRKTPVSISKLEVFATGGISLLESLPVRPQTLRVAPIVVTDAPQEEDAVSPSSENGITTIKAAMFNRKPFTVEQNMFLPSDRIYLVMDLHGLEAGRHQLSAAWVNPEGRTVNTAEHTIILDAPEPLHRSYFWLELMKNGPFTEMFTGREYKKNVYGRWHVDIHLNGQSAGKHNFTIQDG